jgi:virulence-associated protein VagC
MNPYLEYGVFWSSFHSRLIVPIADAISPQILPKYYIEIETRTYRDETESELLVGIPDIVVLDSTEFQALPETEGMEASSVATQNRPQQVEIPMGLELKERFLEVRELGTDTVITVIELLSPKNKRTGTGRLAYEEKRQRVLSSPAHLIEIDLLRAHPPLPLRGGTQWDYRIVVSRSEQRPAAELYGFDLLEPIPSFPLPLKSDEPELWIDLQSIFAGVYTRAGYRYRISSTEAFTG